jgi:hypothetical protein
MVVAVVHEHVHQRAGQQEGIRQDAQDVGAMFGEQQETADRSGHKQRQAGRRPPERR